MRTMKYCPFCGNQQITYADDEVPEYAWCGTCKTWVGASSDYELHEVMYIVQKLKMIPKLYEALREGRK